MSPERCSLWATPKCYPFVLLFLVKKALEGKQLDRASQDTLSVMWQGPTSRVLFGKKKKTEILQD